MTDSDKIEVQNVNQPDYVTRVNRTKYMAMRQALMKVLPDAPPGLTPAEAKQAMLPALDQDLFPGGEKAGWWIKCVQLDLEAKGLIARADKPPVRLYRVTD